MEPILENNVIIKHEICTELSLTKIKRINMPNAYLVGIYNKIIDQEKLQKYAVDALPAMMANGGKKALARSANITQIEGIPPERAVILEFESVEAAKNAYNSEDYQAALKKLDGGADRFLFVIEGA